MPKVNVDLDDSSPVMLLRVWFNIPRLYPGANMAVFVSPSGVGWHVRTDYEVPPLDYIFSQALLWADPVRTQYAIRKYFLNRDEKHLDLMFNEKISKSEVAVPFQKILCHFASDVNEIAWDLKGGLYELADEKIKKLGKKLEPILQKYHRASYVGCIAFNGADLKEDVVKVLTEIADKHNDLKWRVYPVWWPDFDWMIATFTDDKDVAWKKISWIKNCLYKLDDQQNKVYLLKDVDTRLFVKERKAT